jgi:hypothetical protein
MAFTLNSNLRPGDKIELTEPLTVLAGTFSVGHRFTVLDNTGERGVDIVDDEGRKVTECAFVQSAFKKVS